MSPEERARAVIDVSSVASVEQEIAAAIRDAVAEADARHAGDPARMPLAVDGAACIAAEMQRVIGERDDARNERDELAVQLMDARDTCDALVAQVEDRRALRERLRRAEAVCRKADAWSRARDAVSEMGMEETFSADRDAAIEKGMALDCAVIDLSDALDAWRKGE